MERTHRSLTASYAVRFMAKFPRDARVPRQIQSEAAAALLAEMRSGTGLSGSPSSKAHSRSGIAVAAAPEGRIGIDIECRLPDRPIRNIARLLMNETPADDDAAWRVFTFHEAYFKAFGDMAGPERLRAVAATAAPTYRTAEGLNVLHETIDGDFALTLVWDGPVQAVRLLAED